MSEPSTPQTSPYVFYQLHPEHVEDRPFECNPLIADGPSSEFVPRNPRSKRSGKSRVVSVRLPADDWRELSKHSWRRHISREDLIRGAVAEWLERHR
jgi:Ribbon-helix-helix protein, copG family